MSNYKILFILVEGSDDERFFEKVIKPILERRYNTIKIWPYAQETNKRINNMLKSIKQMGANYIYVRDMDKNLCITNAKEDILNSGRNVDAEKIIIIEKEIECWYMAGVTVNSTNRLKISYNGNTDVLNKERFDELIPRKFRSRIDFMQELLEHFSLPTAKRRNKSFKYLLDNYLPRRL